MDMFDWGNGLDDFENGEGCYDSGYECEADDITDDISMETYQMKGFNINDIVRIENMEDILSFEDRLSIETLEKMKKHELTNCVYRDLDGNKMSRDELAQKLADAIKAEGRENEEGMQAEGRSGTGRFCSDNKNAEKLRWEEENIYILYLLCRNMDKVGELLGISRQTVSKKVESYKQIREWEEEEQRRRNRTNCF